MEDCSAVKTDRKADLTDEIEAIAGVWMRADGGDPHSLAAKIVEGIDRYVAGLKPMRRAQILDWLDQNQAALEAGGHGDLDALVNLLSA